MAIVAAPTTFDQPPKKVFTLSSRYDHFAHRWEFDPDFPPLTIWPPPPEP